MLCIVQTLMLIFTSQMNTLNDVDNWVGIADWDLVACRAGQECSVALEHQGVEHQVALLSRSVLAPRLSYVTRLPCLRCISMGFCGMPPGGTTLIWGGSFGMPPGIMG